MGLVNAAEYVAPECTPGGDVSALKTEFSVPVGEHCFYNGVCFWNTQSSAQAIGTGVIVGHGYCECTRPFSWWRFISPWFPNLRAAAAAQIGFGAL